jgi:hypothetical protein
LPRTRVGEKRVYRRVRFARGQATRDRLRLSDDFIDGPDADLAPDELDHDVAPMIETDCSCETPPER